MSNDSSVTTTRTSMALPDAAKLASVPFDSRSLTTLISYGQKDPIYVLVGSGDAEVILAVEQCIAAISRELMEVGLCTVHNLRAALADAGITTTDCVQLSRAWDTYPSSAQDTWIVRVPIDAPHWMRGSTMGADPMAHKEHLPCALISELNELYVPSERPFVYSSDERAALLDASPEVDNEIIFRQVPLGPMELSRSQFGGVNTALSRAFNLMLEAGYEIRVVD